METRPNNKIGDQRQDQIREKPIQAQYPHEYPKLPIGKFNTLGDRRARQKKASKLTDQWTQNSTAAPPICYVILPTRAYSPKPDTTSGDHRSSTPNHSDEERKRRNPPVNDHKQTRDPKGGNGKKLRTILHSTKI